MSAAPVVLVLRAPGTNCDAETAHAFERAGARVVALHVNELFRRPRRLREMDGVAFPGGFSYGDDLGAGTVLAARLRAGPLDEVRRLVDRGGIVLGICNGFQVLARAGLLPGLADPDPPARGPRAPRGGGRAGAGPIAVALAANLQNRYEDRWVTLEAVSPRSVFLEPGTRLRCPVAHAEGRFLPQGETVRRRLHEEGHVALRYVDPGDPARRGLPHPLNPNGSVDDVAGLVDETGRVLGLMPHPERNQFPWHDPAFHAGRIPEGQDGLRIFRRAVAHLRRRPRRRRISG